MIRFKTTKDIKINKNLIDQVIGQENAVEIIKKAAKQRRHVLLIGEPGTGKSMLGMALAELLPHEKLVDILAYPNPNDESQPLIRSVPKGLGRIIVNKARSDLNSSMKFYNIILFIVVIAASLIPYYLWKSKQISDVIYAASMVTSMIFIIGFMLFINMSKNMNKNNKISVPKLIVDNSDKKKAPFIDATGAHAGALLGDVLHDPFQSGGLGTPAHERVVAGMIHKTNKGVLFIDEISTLSINTQQELLTAIQEKKYPITGQSERSAGAMVRTEPVPCDFILVAAGNIETIKNMHPALRSRIRGYGYEVYMNDTMKDTPKNRDKLIMFVAQEVNKDKKIPHFNKDAVLEIIEEARRRANRKGHLTLRLRELGGLIRAAGDLAKEENAKLVSKDHVIRAKKLARTLEKQIADKIIENKKDYNVIITKGIKIGRVNGLAVIGSGSAFSGIVQPIEAETTQPGKNKQILATGNLGKIAKESIINVSAIIKRLFGNDLSKYDVYVQFLQTYEGIEGDSASIATAIAIISALKNIPVKQEIAITGSLSVRGDVLPVGGVSSKVEAAIEAGLKKVIVPKSNLKDIVIDKKKLDKIEIIPVENIFDVFPIIFDNNNSEVKKLIKLAESNKI